MSTGENLRRLSREPHPAFTLVAFVLPIVAAVAVSGMASVPLLNLVHVVTGVIWIGASVYLGVVLGPSLLSLDPEVRGRVNAAIIPKSVLLFAGVGIASLLTGPMLAVEQGRWSLSSPSILAALVLGVALLLVALYLVVVQAGTYGELTGEGPPDPDRMAALGAKIGRASPVMVVLQLAIVLVMAYIRTNGIV